MQGSGSGHLENVRNSYAYSDHGCLALVGVENMCGVGMEDAVLVASKDEAEQIKKVVDQIKGNGLYQALQHNRVYRPWGWYQSLNQGDRYQVKCIVASPTASSHCRATITAMSIGSWSPVRWRDAAPRRSSF